MVAMEPTIVCPKCREEIKLTESLAAPLIEATKKEYEYRLAQKDADVAKREADLRRQEEAVAEARSAIETQVRERLDQERSVIATQESEKARRLFGNDLKRQAAEVAELKSVLAERESKLAEAQKAQAELTRKQRELDDQRRELELTVERRIQAGLGEAREKAKLEAEQGLQLKVREKEEQIASMQRQIEDLKRKAEQGSQQLQGEVLELELEETLRAKFPRDSIEPVGKGEFGGDLVQRVFNNIGQACGAILWETKRTRNWSDGWLTKLRDDQRAAKADMAMIVTQALPKGMTTSFDLLDGVWVTEPGCAIPVAIAIRETLISLAGARQAGEGQQTKTELVYQYLTGPRFKHRVEAIVERFTEMRADLDRERKGMMRLWAKREAQISGVIEATAGMYGDLQGIAGRSLKEIEGLDLQRLEPPSPSQEGE
jgi:hypothetical protein